MPFNVLTTHFVERLVEISVVWESSSSTLSWVVCLNRFFGGGLQGILTAVAVKTLLSPRTVEGGHEFSGTGSCFTARSVLFRREAKSLSGSSLTTWSICLRVEARSESGTIEISLNIGSSLNRFSNRNWFISKNFESKCSFHFTSVSGLYDVSINKTIVFLAYHLPVVPASTQFNYCPLSNYQWHFNNWFFFLGLMIFKRWNTQKPVASLETLSNGVKQNSQCLLFCFTY